MPVNTQELINEIQSWISEPVTEPDRFEKEELHEMVEKSDEYLKELLKQVQSLQSQLSKCKRERDLFAEIDEYLESNSTINYIGTGSKLHRDIKALLQEQGSDDE